MAPFDRTGGLLNTWTAIIAASAGVIALVIVLTRLIHDAPTRSVPLRVLALAIAVAGPRIVTVGAAHAGRWAAAADAARFDRASREVDAVATDLAWHRRNPNALGVDIDDVGQALPARPIPRVQVRDALVRRLRGRHYAHAYAVRTVRAQRRVAVLEVAARTLAVWVGAIGVIVAWRFPLVAVLDGHRIAPADAIGLGASLAAVIGGLWWGRASRPRMRAVHAVAVADRWSDAEREADPHQTRNPAPMTSPVVLLMLMIVGGSMALVVLGVTGAFGVGRSSISPALAAMAAGLVLLSAADFEALETRHRDSVWWGYRAAVVNAAARCSARLHVALGALVAWSVAVGTAVIAFSVDGDFGGLIVFAGLLAMSLWCMVAVDPHAPRPSSESDMLAIGRFARDRMVAVGRWTALVAAAASLVVSLLR